MPSFCELLFAFQEGRNLVWLCGKTYTKVVSCTFMERSYSSVHIQMYCKSHWSEFLRYYFFILVNEIFLNSFHVLTHRYLNFTNAWILRNCRNCWGMLFCVLHGSSPLIKCSLLHLCTNLSWFTSYYRIS